MSENIFEKLFEALEQHKSSLTLKNGDIERLSAMIVVLIKCAKRNQEFVIRCLEDCATNDTQKLISLMIFSELSDAAVKVFGKKKQVN